MTVYMIMTSRPWNTNAGTHTESTNAAPADQNGGFFFSRLYGLFISLYSEKNAFSLNAQNTLNLWSKTLLKYDGIPLKIGSVKGMTAYR